MPVNPSAERCYQVLFSLCSAHLKLPESLGEDSASNDIFTHQQEIVDSIHSDVHRQSSDINGDSSMISGENSNDQMDAVFSMMWPNALFDIEDKGHENSWMDFLNGI